MAGPAKKQVYEIEIYFQLAYNPSQIRGGRPRGSPTLMSVIF